MGYTDRNGSLLDERLLTQSWKGSRRYQTRYRIWRPRRGPCYQVPEAYRLPSRRRRRPSGIIATPKAPTRLDSS